MLASSGSSNRPDRTRSTQGGNKQTGESKKKSPVDLPSSQEPQTFSSTADTITSQQARMQITHMNSDSGSASSELETPKQLIANIGTASKASVGTAPTQKDIEDITKSTIEAVIEARQTKDWSMVTLLKDSFTQLQSENPGNQDLLDVENLLNDITSDEQVTSLEAGTKKREASTERSDTTRAKTQKTRHPEIQRSQTQASMQTRSMTEAQKPKFEPRTIPGDGNCLRNSLIDLAEQKDFELDPKLLGDVLAGDLEEDSQAIPDHLTKDDVVSAYEDGNWQGPSGNFYANYLIVAAEKLLKTKDPKLNILIKNSTEQTEGESPVYRDVAGYQKEPNQHTCMLQYDGAHYNSSRTVLP